MWHLFDCVLLPRLANYPVMLKLPLTYKPRHRSLADLDQGKCVDKLFWGTPSPPNSVVNWQWRLHHDKPDTTKCASVPRLLSGIVTCSSRTGEYRPEVAVVLASLYSVSTATTAGEYSPISTAQKVQILTSESAYAGHFAQPIIVPRVSVLSAP